MSNNVVTDYTLNATSDSYIILRSEPTNRLTEIDNIVLSSDKYDSYEVKGTEHGYLQIVDNNSLDYSKDIIWDTPTVTAINTLETLNRKESLNREFEFVSFAPNYTLQENAGSTGAGRFILQGVAGNESGEYSTVDLNGYNGFKLDNDTVFGLRYIKLTGNSDVITVSNSDASVYVRNSYVDGNIKSDDEITYDLIISGKSTFGGTVGSANATLSGSGSVLKFNDNTFANASLTADEGTLDFVNSTIGNALIGTLTNTSTNGVNINIDVDAAAKTADKITVSNASSGVVTVNDINWITELSDTTPAGADWKVQVLSQPEGSTLTLDLDDSLKVDEYLKNVTITINDTITPIVNSTDKFYNREYSLYSDILHYGKLAADGNFIVLDESRTESVLNSAPTGNDTQIDTLKLLANLVTTENREFNFVNADETYTLLSNIDSVTDGQLSINGKSVVDGEGNITRSIVDMNNNSGLIISKNVTLNINDVAFEGGTLYSSHHGTVISAKHGFLNIDNSVFDNNNGRSMGGGAIALTDGTTEIAFGGLAWQPPGTKASITNTIFSNNKAGSGGAIYIEGADVDIISGAFINNTATGTGSSNGGGAIYQYFGHPDNPNIIRTIAADFEGNSGNLGGALCITQTVDTIINSNFTNNIGKSEGGAIFTQGTLNTIKDSNFIGNTAQIGGAIVNYGTLSNIINTNFFDNSASDNGGAAIFTDQDIKISAIDGISTFRGNYELVDSGEVDVNGAPIYEKAYRAIHIDDSTNILTLDAQNGTITFNDAIVGADDYKISITGDSNGVINFTNGFNDGVNNIKTIASFDGANVNINNGVTVNLNYADNTITDYNPNSINIVNGNLNLILDINANEKTADTISVTGASSGTVNINDINWITELSDTTPAGADWKVQVLSQPEGSALSLALNDSLQVNEYLINKTTRTDTYSVVDSVISIISTTDKFYYKEYEDEVEVLHKGKLAVDGDYITLSETSTTDGNVSSNITNTIEQNSLKLLSELNTTDNREFNFVNADETYTVISDLSSVTAGELSINGNTDGNSIVDLAGFNGLNLNNNTTLNLNNVKLTGNDDSVITVSNSNAVVNLKNANVDGNIDAAVEYDLNLTGNVVLGGKVDNANATLTTASSVLKINSDTFANASLTANRGTIDLYDGNITTTQIDTLYNETRSGVNVSIDVNASANQADNFSFGENSDAAITINNIHFTEGIAPSAEFTATVINPTDGNIELKLSNAIANTVYNNIGSDSKDYILLNGAGEELSTVNDTVKSSDAYAIWNQTGSKYGKITVVDNSKIKLSATGTTWNEKTLSNSIDALANLNQKSTSNDRNFDFVSGYETYNVTENLGTTTSGILNINGSDVNNATVDLNSFNGFTLSNVTDLNINDVTLTGNTDVITVSNTNANINLNNSTIDGNIVSSVAYDLGLTGDTVLNGTIDNANATMTGGSLTINNDTFANATLNANAGTLGFQDGTITAYDFNRLVSDSTANYTIDVDLTNSQADTINATNGFGTVTISDVNFLNSTTDIKTIQILNNGAGSSLVLALDANINANAATTDMGRFVTATTADYVKYAKDTIASAVAWDATIQDRTYYQETQANKTYKNTISLNGTDSIKVGEYLYSGEVTSEIEKTALAVDRDVLAALAQKATTESRTFTTSTANDTYTLTENIDDVTADSLTIQGATGSTVDLNGFNGFTLSNVTDLNINDVTLTGNTDVITVSNTNANINLNNATIDGNISSTVAYDLGLAGTTVLGGTIDNANATMTGGSLTINNDTFANATLNANAGTINLKDNSVSNTQIGKLLNTSTNGVNIAIDIDAQNSSNITADSLTLGAASNGVVTISDINLINATAPDSAFEVKIINTPSANITLKIADEIAGTTYHNLGYTSKNYIALNGNGTVELNEVNDTVSTDDLYENWKKSGTLSGTIGISDTDAHSIALKINGVDWDESSRTSVNTIDSLAALNQKSTSNDRNFNFTSNNKVFTASEDLGTTTAGTLNINGVQDAVLDLNNNNGFVLANPSTLNINNVKVTGNNTLMTVSNSNVDINLNNVYLNGNINSSTAYDLGISGNTTLSGNVGQANANINPNTNLTLLSDNHFNNSNVVVNNNTVLNLANNLAQTQSANSFIVNGNLIMNVDVDLANSSMDRLPANTTLNSGATISVNGINLISDAVSHITPIQFAEDSYKNSVNYIGANTLSNDTQLTTAYAPIYKYSVSYNPEAGSFNFVRDDGSDRYEAYNPSIMVAPVAAQMGGYLTLLNTYDEAFRNMNMYMFLPKTERLAMKNANRYASTASTPYRELSQYQRKAEWYRPYSVFENVKLKNGPKVSNVSYGSFFGADSELLQLKKGWDAMWGIYGSYNGSHQTYDGNGIYQNGGTVGVTGMAYKDNFFTGLTIAAGGNAVNASTMYGNDDFGMLMAGIASKSGYNFEFADGKFILQPNFMMSYSFINTFDYTNAAGVKVETDPLNALQIEPGVRFIGNLKNGMQPYASVSLVWNILDATKVKANDVSIPNLSVKPYVKYGVGVKKTWGEKFTGFLQTYATSGGRNGIGIQFGIRWNF